MRCHAKSPYMFDAEYFKNLLNETSDLINNKNMHKEVEDIDLKIESNKLALQILVEDIEDNEMKQTVKHRLDNFHYIQDDIIIKEKHNKKQYTDVEDDIYKSSVALRDKATRLLDGLVFDKNVLDNVNNKMSKNITQTSENIKRMTTQDKDINTFSLLFTSMLIFIFVYFVIRFL